LEDIGLKEASRECMRRYSVMLISFFDVPDKEVQQYGYNFVKNPVSGFSPTISAFGAQKGRRYRFLGFIE
jgi:hypothetical protein